MKRLLLTISVILAFCFSVSSGDAPENDAASDVRKISVEIKGDAPESDARKAETFEGKGIIPEINEVLGLIKSQEPDAFGKIDSSGTERILNALAESLGLGVKYIPGKTEEEFSIEEDAPKPDERKPYPSLIIASHKVLYSRIDRFSEDSLKMFVEDCESNSRLANKPSGIVVDLRKCSGDDLASLKRTVSFFAPDAIDRRGDISDGAKSIQVNLPLIFLTSPETSGSAELLTYMIRKHRAAMSIGGQTSGLPFELKRHELASGAALMIPVVPDEFRSIPTLPLLPSIQVNPFPQIEYSRISSEIGSEKDDSALMRAVEILICLDAIKDEKSK